MAGLLGAILLGLAAGFVGVAAFFGAWLIGFKLGEWMFPLPPLSRPPAEPDGPFDHITRLPPPR